MAGNVSLQQVCPTVFLRRGEAGLEQLVRVVVQNGGGGTTGAVVAGTGESAREWPLDPLAAGESTHDLYLKPPDTASAVEFSLSVGGKVCDRKQVAIRAPRPWVVHVVQYSHHDVGYTDIPSRVMREHDMFLDQVLDFAAETADFPHDAQFRAIIEQTWSLHHFLQQAPSARAEQMVKLLRSGHLEVMALLGNMTTELCGHEALARSLYHAAALRRRYGIPVISAEHNDIPGISWGLCEVLAGAGVKFFCPGLPFYYQWGEEKLQSFWDQRAIFGHDGPGAFWWEAPGGERVLFWCNNQGNSDPSSVSSLPGLAERLRELEEADYPYSVLRWPVRGGQRDNSPYIAGYAHTIRGWNEKWAYPRLICSTNACFYEDLVTQVPPDLPVWRGELPGQDYPPGATSTADATAINRRAQAELLTAERLSTFAAATTDFAHPTQEIADAYEDVLWHNEHTWGHHSPCGPGHRASETEKAVHAHRAAALAHDVSDRALARVADHVNLETEGVHLVVFNPLLQPRDALVRAPLQEIENCSSTMAWLPAERNPQGEGLLRGVALTDRDHVRPPRALVEGKFDLVEVSTGARVPFQLVTLESPADAVPFAPQRLGLGARSAGAPSGLTRDLVFVANDLPACGYRTYRLVPREDPPIFGSALQSSDTSIENEFYRVELDPARGGVVSIYDKEAGRELLDPAADHVLGEVLVRTPEAVQPRWRSGKVEALPVRTGAMCASLGWQGAIHAHPRVRESVTLYAGVKRVDFAVRILKDATPLLDVHLAFPFAMSPARWRYEGALSSLEPIADFLPGAYSDALAVQHWVKVTEGTQSVLWASLDAPVVNLGGLWPGYVSPAHSCQVTARLAHPPLRQEDLSRGWLYSTLFLNNFGTNFSVSQSGEFLFRYVFTSRAGEVSDAEAARWGWETALPTGHLLTNGPRKGHLPVSESFLEVDRAEVALVTCKPSEDGEVYFVRLWNTGGAPVEAKLWLRFLRLERVRRATLTEEACEGELPHDGERFSVAIPGRGLVNLRLLTSA